MARYGGAVMLQDILSYIAQNAKALCWGIGVGLMLGTFIVGIGAARQYEKGREDGFEAGQGGRVR